MIFKTPSSAGLSTTRTHATILLLSLELLIVCYFRSHRFCCRCHFKLIHFLYGFMPVQQYSLHRATFLLRLSLAFFFLLLFISAAHALIFSSFCIFALIFWDLARFGVGAHKQGDDEKAFYSIQTDFIIINIITIILFFTLCSTSFPQVSTRYFKRQLVFASEDSSWWDAKESEIKK